MSRNLSRGMHTGYTGRAPGNGIAYTTLTDVKNSSRRLCLSACERRALTDVVPSLQSVLMFDTRSNTHPEHTSRT